MRTIALNTANQSQPLQPQQPQQQQQYFLSVMMHIRDEEEMVMEFLQHYLEEGVEHFFIYDDKSTDRTLEMIDCMLTKEQYTIHTSPSLQLFSASNQFNVYRRFYRKIRHRTRWLMVVDVDELITSRAQVGYTIRDILQTSLSDCSLISVPWLLYSWGNYSVTPNHHVRESLVYRWGLHPKYARGREVSDVISITPLQKKKIQRIKEKQAAEQQRMDVAALQQHQKQEYEQKQRLQQKRRSINPPIMGRSKRAGGHQLQRRLTDIKFRDRHEAIENKLIIRTDAVKRLETVHHASINQRHDTVAATYDDLMQLNRSVYHIYDEFIEKVKEDIKKKRLAYPDSSVNKSIEEESDRRSLLALNKKGARKKKPQLIPWGLICIPHTELQLHCAKDNDLSMIDSNVSLVTKKKRVFTPRTELYDVPEHICPPRNRYVDYSSFPRTTIREEDVDKLLLVAFHYRIKSEYDWFRKTFTVNAFNKDYQMSGRETANRLDILDDFMTKKRQPVMKQRIGQQWVDIQTTLNNCTKYYPPEQHSIRAFVNQLPPEAKFMATQSLNRVKILARRKQSKEVVGN